MDLVTESTIDIRIFRIRGEDNECSPEARLRNPLQEMPSLRFYASPLLEAFWGNENLCALTFLRFF